MKRVPVDTGGERPRLSVKSQKPTKPGRRRYPCHLVREEKLCDRSEPKVPGTTGHKRKKECLVRENHKKENNGDIQPYRVPTHVPGEEIRSE